MENKDFAVFIMVHGRPERVRTMETLRKQGYTGSIYLLADNEDVTLGDYVNRYGESVIVFDKKTVAQKTDSGDNTGDRRSTLFASMAVFDVAEEKHLRYFYLLCDDYYDFYYAFIGTKGKVICNDLDRLFNCVLQYYKSIDAASIAFAQTGDFIGGIDNGRDAYRFSKRKAMNTFLLSTERRFDWYGRLNEDVTTYCLQGSMGRLFLTIPVIAIGQPDTQKSKKGLTEAYIDNGTYIKSMFSVIYNPSCVKASMMNANHKRIHHSINWKATTPMIISEKYRRTPNG